MPSKTAREPHKESWKEGDIMKMYFVSEADLETLHRLFEYRTDGMYFELRSYNNFVDIAQYSQKYRDVHFITVHRDKLDPKKCLGYRDRF